METNIVQKLLKGSAEIDRMRSEIDKTISLLIGFLMKVEPMSANPMPVRTSPLDRSGFKFNYDVETWMVGRIMDSNKIFIELEVSPWEGVRTVYNSEWGKKLTVEAGHVRGIHKALPRLIEGLMKEYPALNYAWAPLIKAAE